MATFLVILADDQGNENWSYPTEINAVDKRDAYNAIAENVPQDSIKNILTIKEYQDIISKKGFRQINNAINSGSENYESSADFFKNITNAAMAMAESNQNDNAIPNNTYQQVDNSIPNNTNQQIENVQQSNVKYFEDNGNFYKIENNILYKKCWENVELKLEEDKSEQYRIINEENNKIVNNPKYKIQKLTWKQLA
jgi:hypothetical protein